MADILKQDEIIVEKIGVPPSQSFHKIPPSQDPGEQTTQSDHDNENEIFIPPPSARAIIKKALESASGVDLGLGKENGTEVDNSVDNNEDDDSLDASHQTSPGELNDEIEKLEKRTETGFNLLTSTDKAAFTPLSSPLISGLGSSFTPISERKMPSAPKSKSYNAEEDGYIIVPTPLHSPPSSPLNTSMVFPVIDNPTTPPHPNSTPTPIFSPLTSVSGFSQKELNAALNSTISPMISLQLQQATSTLSHHVSNITTPTQASTALPQNIRNPLSLPFNRELTELVYFYRILYEAMNPRTPLLERLRFLAITSQNIDMFFCKRALIHLGRGLSITLHSQTGKPVTTTTQKSSTPNNTIGAKPSIKELPPVQVQQTLETLRKLVNDKYNLFNTVLVPELTRHGVNFYKWGDLSVEEQTLMRDYYIRRVFPLMTPLVVDAGHPFPNLSNLSLNVAVLLEHDRGGSRFVRIKVPSRIPRWIHLNSRGPFGLISMEELILANIDTLFPNTTVISASVFRVTRHYDLKLEGEDDAHNLLELIKSELLKRRFAPMVRLEYDSAMPQSMLSLLSLHLHLRENDLYKTDGPLGLADLFELCKFNLPHLKYEPWIPRTPDVFANLKGKYSHPGDLFHVIRKGDLLVQHPYVSFTSTVQFFIECAVQDPKVLAIKMSIYRTSSNSALVKALCEAALHKEVSVLVDLKASGDEEQNARYARMLEEAGCHVSYGLVGLKTHAKIAMAVREEEDGVLREYVHISTGNYNASTGDVYVDIGLFSSNVDLGRDMCDLFNYLTGYNHINSFRRLISAPMSMRDTFVNLICREAEMAKRGLPATILAIMNGLDEKRIVQALYDASVAGVSIRLVVRGRCRLLPGIPGVSENIQVISIMGRFLEHSRIFYFSNAAGEGQPKAYIGSADWQHRNLKRRVEVLVPVDDAKNIAKLHQIVLTYLEDKHQAWEMMGDGRYRKKMGGSPETSAQQISMTRTQKEHPIIWDAQKR